MLLCRKSKKADGIKNTIVLIGVSGGTDSTYTLWLSKQLGLRPLAVHLDDGWNSNIAVTNIKNATDKLGIALYTHVIDWEEIKSLQVAFCKASLPDPGVPSDVAIHGALYREAIRENLQYILGGQSFMTEGTQPREWSYIDGTYVKTINKLFNQNQSLKSYPNATIYQIAYYLFIRGIKQIPFLNYLQYTKEEARKLLQQELGWQYYGGHHYESKFTQFIYAYYNPKKFNIDRRKVTLSGPIRMGKLEREKALEVISRPPEIPEELIEFCIKKLGLTMDEWEKIMARKPKNFLDFHTSFQTVYRFKWILRLAVKHNLVTPVLYEKYVG